MLRESERAILSEAAARRLPLVLSLPSTDALQHYKSRFLMMSDQGLWIESVSAEQPVLAGLAATFQPLGLSFRSGASKFTFVARLAATTERFRLHADGNETVPALRLELPQELKTIQRRAAYRARVGPDDLSVAVWRIGPEAPLLEEPGESHQLAAEARDVSLGGLGMLIRPIHGRAAMVLTGERLRVEMAGEEGLILLEGRLRGGRPSEEANALLIGVQWIFPEHPLDGRKINAYLEKLITRLQRQELRRTQPARQGHS